MVEEEDEEEVELFREPRVLLSHEFLAAWISFIRTPRWCSSSCRVMGGKTSKLKESTSVVFSWIGFR